MYYKLPVMARLNLVWKPYGKRPMTLAVIRWEVVNKTKLGEHILLNLGYEDD
jgi:hypothetical protein